MLRQGACDHGAQNASCVEHSGASGTSEDFAFSEHLRLQNRLGALKKVVEGEDYKIIASDSEKRQMLEEPPNALDESMSKRRWEHLMWRWRQAIRLAAIDARRAASGSLD